MVMENIEHKEPLRLLLIDDSLDDVTLIAHELASSYDVTWFRVETEAALIVALNARWDAVLCDYHLPHMNVEKALDLVRSDVYNHEIPFIVISGVVDESVAIDILKKGANDFVSKDKIQRLSLTIRRERKQAEERISLKQRTEARIRESYDATLEAWGRALELRDIHTKGHTVRVVDMTLKLALSIGVSHNEFTNLYRGAYLHDIGKMGIPDSILLKRDVLDLDEMNIMKQHPTIARDMLKNIPFLRDAVEIPYCHHERWDGSGYPQGLKRESIPFLARMFMVIDVYDALTSRRPYREAWDKSKAIAFLLSERDITFDPNIIDALVEMVGRA